MIAGWLVPGHAVISDTCTSSGLGLIVISKLSATDVQPSLVAVTAMVAVISEPVKLLGAVKVMLPVPLAAMPTAVLVLVHAKVAPVTDGVVLKGMLTGSPAQ